MAKASKFERLVRKADDAGKIRRYSVNPDVVALRVERVMKAVTILFWLGVILGLGFTVTNVAKFVGGITGWLVSPAINAPLIALLIAGSIMARYHVKPGWQVQFGKWLLLAFEYGLNTWTYWVAGSADEIFKHSVPVVIVIFCAEGVTDLRSGMTKCVEIAYESAARLAKDVEQIAPVAEKVEEPADSEPVPAAGKSFEEEPVIIELPPVVVEPVAEIATETTHYRPEGGKRAAQLAADIAALKAEFGDGIAFVTMNETDRMKAVKALFKCGNSRAIRLAGEYTRVVESELRSEIA